MEAVSGIHGQWKKGAFPGGGENLKRVLNPLTKHAG
ncbi:hypothetical protein BSTP3_272 [Bacillus phage BSTP3]|nr:hypothetical protein BSTP3_272 [Bacillus phage BSTP3]